MSNGDQDIETEIKTENEVQSKALDCRINYTGNNNLPESSNGSTKSNGEKLCKFLISLVPQFIISFLTICFVGMILKYNTQNNPQMPSICSKNTIFDEDLSEEDFKAKNVSTFEVYKSCMVEIKCLQEHMEKKINDSYIESKRSYSILNGEVEIIKGKYVSQIETIFYVVYICTVELLVLLIFLRKGNLIPNQTGRQSHRQQTEHHDETTRKDLKRNICVVSFNKKTQPLHKTLVESAVPRDIPTVTMIVREPAIEFRTHLESKWVFVFVDNNKRNVVLENKDDLGDIKCNTVEEARAIGADVFVVYVNHTGSSNLPERDLYNQQMRTFTDHPVLRELSEIGRALSVYETFTDYQKHHIHQCIVGNEVVD